MTTSYNNKERSWPVLVMEQGMVNIITQAGRARGMGVVKKINNIHVLFVVLFLSVVMGHSADATGQADGRISLSGFGTFGLVTADSDTLGFRRNVIQDRGVFSGDIGVTTDSLLGLQVNGRATASIDGVLQVVLRDQPDFDFDSLLQLAFIGVQPPGTDVRMRLGRIKTDIYLLSDYRDIGFAYLWARPITEFYAMLPFQNYDGLDISWAPSFAGGVLHMSLFGGWTGFDAGNGKLSIDDSPIYGLSLLFEKGDWQLKAGLARLEYKNVETGASLASFPEGLTAYLMQPELLASMRDSLSPEGVSSVYSSIGFSYDDGKWLLSGEGAILDSTGTFPSSVQGYLSLGHRFGEITPYVTWSIIEMLHDDTADETGLYPITADGSDSVASFFNNLVAMNQYTISVGTRWDFTARSCLKLQWNHSRVRDSGMSLWLMANPATGFPEGNQDINVISINLDFTF